MGVVYLVDDDPAMVSALSRLLRAECFEVRAFTSANAFLEAFQVEEAACLVLDLEMPELDGLELQRRLVQQKVLIPIIFLTGHGDIPTSVSAMKAGARDFLTKPVDAAALIEAVQSALALALVQVSLAARLATLSPREREVMKHVVAGKLNKQIAAELGTGEQNIKQRRAQVMRKMGVESVAELVRAAQRLGIGI